MTMTADRPRGHNARLDLLGDSALQHEIPGLATAFDLEAMQERLQDALFGTLQPPHTIEGCSDFTCLTAEGCCILRYHLEVRNNVTGKTFAPLVIGRIFPSLTACEAYARDRLVPLAARVAGRADVTPFRAPVALLKSLNMVVSVFPIDAQLPTLIGATDPARMTEIFREVLAGGAGIRDCTVELHHYKHIGGCVLRYHVQSGLRGAGADEADAVIVYGKVAPDTSAPLAFHAIEALRERLRNTSATYQFNVPRPLGFWPDLQLMLLEAIPGSPRRIHRLLKKRLCTSEDAKPRKLTLEAAIDACARIAGALHTLEMRIGPRRTFGDELTELDLAMSAERSMPPEFKRQLRAWLERVRAHAARSDPLRPCFSHGDFNHKQVLFDGTASGLVDFDTVCQAEPALDLGEFLAYLRLAIQKMQEAAAPAAGQLMRQLTGQFLGAYVAAVGGHVEDESPLRVRVSLYEALTLLHVAVRSWQRLKRGRLDHVVTVLEHIMSDIP